MNKTDINFLVVYNIMHFAEALSVLLTQNRINCSTYILCLGPDAQTKEIENAAELILDDFRVFRSKDKPPEHIGHFSTFISRIDLRDKRVPEWAYNACGPETIISMYGSDTMAYYPVNDNAYNSLRVTNRYACSLAIGGGQYQASGKVFSLDKNSLKRIVSIISSSMGVSSLSVPNRPYVLICTQYPEYFLRERGLTPELLNYFFERTIDVCLSKGYAVYIKPHYRHFNKNIFSEDKSKMINIQNRLRHWPVEFTLPYMVNPPAAVVGHWSTSLFTLPFIHNIPAFSHMLPEYFRYLEDWKDPAATKYGLLLHFLNVPPLEILPNVKEQNRVKQVYSDWLSVTSNRTVIKLLRVAFHIKFNVPDLHAFNELRDCTEVSNFPSGLFNSQERTKLHLWADGEYELFCQMAMH